MTHTPKGPSVEEGYFAADMQRYMHKQVNKRKCAPPCCSIKALQDHAPHLSAAAAATDSPGCCCCCCQAGATHLMQVGILILPLAPFALTWLSLQHKQQHSTPATHQSAKRTRSAFRPQRHTMELTQQQCQHAITAPGCAWVRLGAAGWYNPKKRLLGQAGMVLQAAHAP
jgi:hypothetical protein